MQWDLDPQSHDWAEHERIIVFDGVCKWCNTWVDFIIARDPLGTFKFGTLQSHSGRQLLELLRLPAENFATFLLLERGRVFTKSTAALRIVRHLSPLWPLYYVAIAVPRRIRDAVYDFVARRRYRWMGKTATCRVPTPAERERFV